MTFTITYDLNGPCEYDTLLMDLHLDSEEAVASGGPALFPSGTMVRKRARRN